MDILRPDELERFVQVRGEPCVSLFMPTARRGPDGEQAPIRLKNLLRQADAALADRGLRPRDRKGLLERAAELLDDSEFWRHQADGLALFAAPDDFRALRLPMRFEELVDVGDRYHVKPLFEVVDAGARVYILALSQNEIRLLVAGPHDVSTVELGDVPDSMAEALKYDDREKYTGFRESGSQLRGGPAVFYGHGAKKEGTRHKKDLVRYFQIIDHGLHDVLDNAGVPLVLAGVEYETAAFRKISRYPDILKGGISGNPEHMSLSDLHERAWRLGQSVLQRRRREHAARFAELVGTGRASSQAEEVVQAAAEGRVDALFVARDASCWGNFDPTSAVVDLHEAREPQDVDVLDVAVVDAWRQHGSVYCVDRGEVPNGESVAAIFRY